jgi:hypothetical protein
MVIGSWSTRHLSEGFVGAPSRRGGRRTVENVYMPPDFGLSTAGAANLRARDGLAPGIPFRSWAGAAGTCDPLPDPGYEPGLLDFQAPTGDRTRPGTFAAGQCRATPCGPRGKKPQSLPRRAGIERSAVLRPHSSVVLANWGSRILVVRQPDPLVDGPGGARHRGLLERG